MDSNKLPENWVDTIINSNPDSHYRWEKLNDDLRAHEDDIEDQANEHDDNPVVNNDENKEGADTFSSKPSILDSDILDGTEPPPPSSKNLPTRILEYSSRQLFNLFSRCKCGSVSSSLKSSCKMWKHMFIFMLKDNSHWIPVVWVEGLGGLSSKLTLPSRIKLILLNMLTILANSCDHNNAVLSQEIFVIKIDKCDHKRDV